MNENAIAVLGDPELIAELHAELSASKILVSAPQPIMSEGDALDAALSAEDIQTIAQTITAVFAAGTGVLVFAEKLRKVVHHHEKPTTLQDARTGENLGRVDPHATIDDIAGILDNNK